MSVEEPKEPKEQTEAEAIEQILSLKPKIKRRGIPWYLQKLGEPPIDVIRRIRAEIRANPDFRPENLDHASENFKPGLSNKQATILAYLLTGVKPNSYDEAWMIVQEVAIG